MTLGIVGHEAAKFTPTTERIVRRMIRAKIDILKPALVVSGACPLGGIDIWAIEEADACRVATQDFQPRSNDWSTGFKPRNIQIAEASDVVICFVVDRLPATYTGRRFDLCYHCVRRKGGGTDHIKSGGCWTVNHAESIGKMGEIIIVEQQP